MDQFNIGDRVRINYATLSEACPNLFRDYHGKIGRIIEFTAPQHKSVTLEFDDKKNKNVSVMYLEKITTVNVGDRVRCAIDRVVFISGSEHIKDQEFVIDQQYMLPYFQWAVDRGDYELMPKATTYRVHLTSYGSLTGQIFETLRFDTLADAIVNAYHKVDEYGWNQATVHVDISGTSPMLYGAFKRATDTESIKTSDCKVTTAEIAAALKRMLACEE